MCIEYGYPLIVVFVSEHDLTFHREAASAFYGGYGEVGGTLDRLNAFAAGVFHAMRYMSCFNPSARWRRIGWALEHRDELTAVLP